MSQEKNPNIFIFSTAYLPFIGGAELAIKEIADRIQSANFFLITSRLLRNLPREERMGNVLVYRLGFGFAFDKILFPFFGFFKFFSLTKKLKTNNYKLLIWGMMASYASIAAYFLKLLKPGLPFLLSLQEGDAESHLRKGKFGLVGFFGKRIIKKADRIQVISGFLKDFALSQGAKSRIDIIPNGVDIRGFSRIISNTEKAALKNRLAINLNDRVVISVSRLVYKNGLDILVKSIKSIKSGTKFPTIKVILIGEGGKRKELEGLVRKLGLEKSVIFLGSVPNQDLPLYFSIADIFVRPSRSEGLGTAFLEAMAADVPIVATAVGGIPDFLKDGETGLFCEVKNPESITAKIRILLENRELREKIIKNAKEMVLRDYDWDLIAKKMKNIFKQLQNFA